MGLKMANTTQHKEIHKTEYLDKKLPTLYVQRSETKSITEGTNVIIEVSDKTSQAALDTFKQVKELMDLK